jgi:hypothetical protein
MNTLRIGSILFLLALAGCGAGDNPAPASTAAPSLLSQSGPAPSVRQGAAPEFITFRGNLSQYTVTPADGGFTVTDIVSGAAQLVPPNSRLRFADSALALDLDGVAGQAYRLYQAAFNRKPDLPGLGFQMNALEGLGRTLPEVAQNFIDSPEFSSTYGSLDTVAFVTLLYANVLRRAPDPEGLAFHVGYLNGTQPDGRRITRAEDLTGFSESPENKALVLPAIKNGIEYIPYGSNAPANPPTDFVGVYTGSIRGDDSGVLTMTVTDSGALVGAFHSNAFNVDMSGVAAIAVGGRFSVTLAGGDHSFDFNGSLNLANGVVAGAWNVTGIPSVGGLFYATRPAPPPPISYAVVGPIIAQRCMPCHSAQPTQPGYGTAPLGIRFDSEADVRARAGDIQRVAVIQKSMPYGNITNMTQAERDLLAAWFAAGMP